MLVSAAWLGPAILGAVNEIAQRRLDGSSLPGAGALLFASGDWLVYAGLTPAVFAISRRWPLARPHLGRHLALHLVVSLFFCAAWAAAGAVLRALLMPEALYGGAGRHFVSWLFITLPFGVAVYLAVVGIEHATRYFEEARDRDLQVSRLSEQLATARLAALQAQVNPHFLFNTLNTIAVLVRDDDRAGATRIVEQLADVLRRTLGRNHASEVTLDEEMSLVRQYLAIEQARFSDRLHVTYAIDQRALTGAVPGFALQHLVENAVRHGIAPAPDGGELRVEARRDGDALELRVVDTGVGLAEPRADDRGHGLANTRDRLEALYGSRASLVVARRSASGGTVATLRLPYRALEPPPEAGGPDAAR
jgi:two-component system, LytTR family, sensor kinase